MLWVYNTTNSQLDYTGLMNETISFYKYCSYYISTITRQCFESCLFFYSIVATTPMFNGYLLLLYLAFKSLVNIIMPVKYVLSWSISNCSWPVHARTSWYLLPTLYTKSNSKPLPVSRCYVLLTCLQIWRNWPLSVIKVNTTVESSMCYYG